MSATNHTANYNLPQFIGTDVPSWLTDINGAFSAIDTAIDAAKDAADGAAGDVTALGSRVTTAEGDIGGLQSRMTTAEGKILSDEGAIAANTSKIGAAALDTEAQNLSGAVNELNAKIDARQTAYDLLQTWLENGTKTLASAITNYRYILFVGYASGQIYESRMVPVEMFTTDTALSRFYMILCTYISGNEHRITAKFDSATSVTVSSRSGMNLKIYGVS